MREAPRWWIPCLAACGFLGISSLGAGSPALPAAPAPTVEVASAEVAQSTLDPRESALRADIRVRAFQRAYGTLIDSVTYRDDDLVFSMAGEEIHFQDGRLLAEERLERRERCDPIFYHYPLEMPQEPPPLPEGPTRLCTDVQDALWGRTESDLRARGRTIDFVERRVFVNDVVANALERVERELYAIAATDRAVAAWIEEVQVAYSFIDRGIAGTATRSQHAWGLAVDLVPHSYDGREAYWRWSRVWSRQWHEIPMDERWSPPSRVVETFERHGFLWGGKWAHFDNIHFEYRPEILEYNRLLEVAAQ